MFPARGSAGSACVLRANQCQVCMPAGTSIHHVCDLLTLCVLPARLLARPACPPARPAHRCCVCGPADNWGRTLTHTPADPTFYAAYKVGVIFRAKPLNPALVCCAAPCSVCVGICISPVGGGEYGWKMYPGRKWGSLRVDPKKHACQPFDQLCCRCCCVVLWLTWGSTSSGLPFPYLLPPLAWLQQCAYSCE